MDVPDVPDVLLKRITPETLAISKTLAFLLDQGAGPERAKEIMLNIMSVITHPGGHLSLRRAHTKGKLVFMLGSFNNPKEGLDTDLVHKLMLETDKHMDARHHGPHTPSAN